MGKKVGITHYRITSNQLPVVFDGFKIAVVSDLHNANVMTQADLAEELKISSSCEGY